MEYIIVFFFSIFFAHLADIYLNSRNRILGKIFLIISALLPILLAGFRDITVGTDTSNYCEKFLQALNCNTFKQFSYLSDMEIGFQYIVYLCSRISKNPIVYFLIVHTLVIIPIYIAISNLKSHKNFAIGLFVYYFSFYCSTLNITRQNIAGSLVLLSITFMLNNKNIKSFIAFILAVLFHKTAILFIFIVLIYKIVQKYNIKEKPHVYIILLLSFTIVTYVLIQYTNIITIIIGQREQYALYLEGNDGTVSKSSLILYILTLIVMWRGAMLSPNNKTNFFLVNSLLACIIIFMSTIAVPFSRLTMYFSMIQVISIPYLFCNYYIDGPVKKKLVPTTFKYMYIVYNIIFWYFSIIVKTSHQVYPYLIA